MVSAKKENMVSALKMLQEDFGGAEKYMTERCGLSSSEIAQLRKNLLES